MNLLSRFVILLAACALGGASAAVAQEVNVYNGRHYSTDNAIYQAFAQKTGIKVNMIEGDSDQLVQRIKSEGANSPADVLITVDAGRLAAAAREGIFQPARSATLEQIIPAALRDPDGQWFGLATRARVLVYARDRVKASELSSYEALADPKWKGRILVRSGTYIYNLSLMGSIIAANGEAKAEEWAKGLVANFARAPKGGDTDQLKAVAAGEGDIAISNTYYLARLIASSKPEDKAIADKLGIFFPNQDGRGTHVNVSGAGIVKTAKNPDNAVKLLEYLAGAEAQRYFADSSMEFPVNPAVKPHSVLAEFGAFKADRINAAQYANLNRQAMMIMDRAGWR